jgi:putative solute:sodium symporter small subunit
MGQYVKPETLNSEAGKALLSRYWRQNLGLMSILLVIWALVSLGCGVLWADTLNVFNLPGTGYPLGFWFAQQGSIVTFVILILVYAFTMNKIDRRHHQDLLELEQGGRS